MKKIIFLILNVMVLACPLLALDAQVYFSPAGGCQNAIIQELNNATQTIDIAMYTFTSREIAQELIKKKNNGIKIRIVLDKDQKVQSYSKSKYLINHGVEVRYHMGAGLMHNKFAIIDGKILITGSFNWTATAEQKNEENLLVISDINLIKKYQERFENLWQTSL